MTIGLGLRLRFRVRVRVVSSAIRSSAARAAPEKFC